MPDHDPFENTPMSRVARAILEGKVERVEEDIVSVGAKVDLVLKNVGELKDTAMKEIAQLLFRVGALERESEKKEKASAGTARTVLKAGLDFFMAVTLALALYKMGLK